ncbi:UDP-N-acetylmuramoyl-L-alanine--D-glutamate ligase [Melaminivora sp.]
MTTEPRPDPAPAAMPPTEGGVPEVAPQLNAAAEAAQFVARMFAQVRAEGAAQATAQPASPPDQAAAAGLVESPEASQAATVTPQQALQNVMQGQRVLILGLGASGLAMARWCQRCGAQVHVADTRQQPPQLAQLQAELPQVGFSAGPLEAALQAWGAGQRLDAIYRSPGLSPADIAPISIAASHCQTPILAEIDLFSQALAGLRAQCGYAPALLAVTGTNGKTTVTSLTRHLLAHAGLDSVLAGNIGPTLLDTLAARLDAGRLPQAWALELSSFQLDGARQFEPSAAVVLNLTQDHLDWHGDLQAYGAAKARIFGRQALMVLNREDPAVMAMLAGAQAEPAEQSGTAAQTAATSAATSAAVPVKAKSAKAAKPLPPRAHITFGADLPRRPGDFGIETVSGMAWLVRAHEADATERSRRRTGAQAGQAEPELHLQRLMPEGALRIRGRHNSTNALAALALAQAAGCALAPLLHGLREYRGEPHRVEPVALLHEVEYFDDSKGTNVGATVAALAGLGAERRVLVILGGDGKGQDFAPLAAPVTRYARAVLLIGRDAPLIRAALQGCEVPLIDAASLPEAVQLAAARAQAGDAVLLSPACASWDMFNGYEHRAQVFCAAVQALAEDAGQPMLVGSAAGGLA